MARTFGGSTQEMTCSSFGAPPSAGTISIWINPNWNGADGVIHRFWSFNSSTTGNPDAPSFQKDQFNNIVVGFNGGGGGDQRISLAVSTNFVSGTWANWVFTYSNAAGQTLYKNANSLGTHSLTLPTLVTGYCVGNMAQPANQQNCNASLAEFAVWNRILNQSEITALARGIPIMAIGQANLLVYTPLFGIGGVGTGEPDWGPSRFAQTVTGAGFHNHAPVSLWQQPATIMPFLSTPAPAAPTTQQWIRGRHQTPQPLGFQQ